MQARIAMGTAAHCCPPAGTTTRKPALPCAGHRRGLTPGSPCWRLLMQLLLLLLRRAGAVPASSGCCPICRLGMPCGRSATDPRSPCGTWVTDEWHTGAADGSTLTSPLTMRLHCLCACRAGAPPLCARAWAHDAIVSVHCGAAHHGGAIVCNHMMTWCWSGAAWPVGVIDSRLLLARSDRGHRHTRHIDASSWLSCWRAWRDGWWSGQHTRLSAWARGRVCGLPLRTRVAREGGLSAWRFRPNSQVPFGPCQIPGQLQLQAWWGCSGGKGGRSVLDAPWSGPSCRTPTGSLPRMGCTARARACARRTAYAADLIPTALTDHDRVVPSKATHCHGP